MSNAVDSEEAWYDELYRADFVNWVSSTWARNEGLPGEPKMVRGETRRIEFKKNSITRLHQLEAESEGDIRKALQDVRAGFQGLPDELYVLWSSLPHPPSDRHYWHEHNDKRIVAEACALACKAGQLLVAVSALKRRIGDTPMNASEPAESNSLIDTYLSDQWRICGGAPNRQLREEFRDRLIPVVIKFFGSVDASLDVLLKESPCSNGNGIKTLVRAYELYCLRMKREAVETRDEAREQFFARFETQFHDLHISEREALGTAAFDSEEIRAILRTDFCLLPANSSQGAGGNKRRGRRPNP
jgi:hypothetical protein